ncbi:iron ABC transporter substrate-binding protein [Arthrobacter sp. H14]|uniref:iron ABC transporter substrate-binding protein n=1 Tax=Arthrobacter sp. H14 TaxID=1312959 RepID=UPI0020A65925|nr:iron ABC transporter substrate-binding protein [Arthrobacter sp. H14]
MIALASAAVLTMTGCGASTEPSGAGQSESPAAGGSSEALTVYNAQHDSLTQAWADAFTAETGIEVTLRQGSDYELSNQIIAEGEASPADVFLTENSPAMTQVANAGLFAEVNTDIIEQVPAEYRPSTNMWTGIAARSTVFVYNEDAIDESELPESIMDLQNEQWNGRWGASPTGADFQAIVSAMLELEGEEATAQWLAAMKDNAEAYKGNTAVMKAVNAGQIDGGVIYHYYYYGDQAETGENSDNVSLHYFKDQDPGAFVSVSGGGVLASSDQPDQAQQFLTFITGKAGQQVLQDGDSFEYPVASGVAPNEALVPLEELEAPEIDAAKLNSEKVTELMIDAGLL